MIYFVTDRTLCSKEHYLKVIEQSCEAGVEAIILREKDLNSEELLALASEVKTLVSGTNTKLIINSNIYVAKAIKANGIHLSYKDFMAHKQGVDYEGVIGISIHSVEEGIIAYENGADYIMYGHVFESSCKKGVPPRGLEALTQLKSKIKIPIVAIGGIDEENFRYALNAGADKIAIRSGILECDDVFSYLCEFINI